ncbi:iron-sulfur cluster carrier protein ApbC [Halomonas campaniensis]|uniref:iron-sulfur cluster carrier protein ApbC n=1 Tax=Halomonas campaniensis TaxID=213554 RepID=UPI002483CBCE|nr:iron-sulfur cluster carrier protein ApbC [Halomonas campaniensis]
MRAPRRATGSNQRPDTSVTTAGFGPPSSCLAPRAGDGHGAYTGLTPHRQDAPAGQAKEQDVIEGVKHIVAVASGKGGVGKSTVTVNLALAMAAEGYRVGILDADIYGPSQAQMLGVGEGVRPQAAGENRFLPLEAHGLQAMSMAFMVDVREPMVWRGPMVAGAFQQLLTQTAWEDLDVLFIDMPPGTGDIQLTLAQKVPVDGAVIVTTPQDIALLDARKGIEMFRKVNVPVLGVVENMSLHVCSQCGHAEPIFGEGGGERIATEYETRVLGRLPLTLAIREQADGGRPTVVAEPDGEVTATFREMARQVAEQLEGQAADSGPSISFSD